MNMITKLATKLLAALSIVATMTSPVQALDAGDMAFAFSKAPESARSMSAKEMQETEGAVAPVVAYGLVVGGRIVYVGISNNVARRATQHAANKAFDSVVQFGSSNSRTAARVIEQNNINRFDTIRNGLNQRNSIAPSNPLSGRVSQPYR